MTVRAALVDLPDPGIAERLVMAHLVEGVSLAHTARRLGLPHAIAADVLADALVRLRTAFAPEVTVSDRDTSASEQKLPIPTPWNTSTTESDQPSNPPVSRDDSAPGEGTTRPGGFIGSRPPEPGESAPGPASEETPRATPWSRLSDSDARDGVGGDGETAEMVAAESSAIPASASVVEHLLGYFTRRDTAYWCQLKPDSVFADWGWSSDEQLPALAPDLPLSCIDMVVYAAVAAGALRREQVRAIYNWDDPDDFSRRWVHELPGLLVPAGRQRLSDRDTGARPQHGDVVMWFGADEPGGEERLMHVAVADGKADRRVDSASVLSFGARCPWLLAQPRRGATRLSGVEVTTIADISNAMLANWSHTVRVEFGPGPWTQPPATGTELRVPPSRESRALRPFNKKNWRREFPDFAEWVQGRPDVQRLTAAFDEWERAEGAAGAPTRLVEMVDAAVSSTRIEEALRSPGALPIDGHPQVAVQVDRDDNPTGLRVASMGGHGRVLRKLFTERPDVLDTIPRHGGRLRIAYDGVQLRIDGEVRSERLQPDGADPSRKLIPGRLLDEYLRLCSAGVLDKPGTKPGKSPKRPTFEQWIQGLPPSVFKGPGDSSYTMTTNGHILTDRAVEEGCRPPRASESDDPHGVLAALRRVVLEAPDDVARPAPIPEQPAQLTERSSEVLDLGVMSARVTVGKDPSGTWRLLVPFYSDFYPGDVLAHWCRHLHARRRRRLLNLIRRQLNGRVVASPATTAARPGYIGSRPTDSSDSAPPVLTPQERSALRAELAALLPVDQDEGQQVPVRLGPGTVLERLLTEEFVADPLRSGSYEAVTEAIADTVATAFGEPPAPAHRILVAAIHGILADWAGSGDASLLRRHIADLVGHGPQTVASGHPPPADTGPIGGQSVSQSDAEPPEPGPTGPEHRESGDSTPEAAQPDDAPTDWLPSAQVPRTVVSLIRGLSKEGMTRVLADPAQARAVIAEVGRRFAETDLPVRVGGVTRRLAELFPPDELAYQQYSLERSIASGCLQYQLTETALQQMMSHPERVAAALQATYSEVEPGYFASWLDDDYVMHGRDGYPRDSGQHAFMQAAVEHLTAVWDLVDGPVWQELAAIKDERSRDRAPMLNSIPPHRRAELDLPAHSVDEFSIPGDNTVLSAATNMGSVQIVLRGYLESLAEHADVIEGWPWASIQHGVLEFASRLSVLAGVTFTTLGEFTEPRDPPRFAVEFDTANQTITSVAITGPAKQARADDRGGVCPGFVTFDPAGAARPSTDRLRQSLADFDVEAYRQTSGSKIAVMVGGFLLPLLGRDFPQLRFTEPTLTGRMSGCSGDPVRAVPRRAGRSSGQPGDDRREHLLTQFLAVAADQGYGPMSLETVLERAQLTRRTYFRMYSGKRSGFEAACASAIDRVRTACDAAMPDAHERHGGVRSRLETATRAYLTALAEHPDEACVLHRDMFAPGLEARPLHDQHWSMLAEHFARSLGPIDTHTGRLLAAAVTGIVTDRIRAVGAERRAIANLPDLTPTVTALTQALLPGGTE